MSSKENVSNNIPKVSHDVCKQLAGLSLMIYDYGKKFKLNQEETIESFVSNMDDSEKQSYSPTRNKMFEDMSEFAPQSIFHLFVDDEDTDLQACVMESPINKQVIVVFRGSESLYDWYHDFMVMKTNIEDNIYVHSGFYKMLRTNNAYEKLRDKVLEVLTVHSDYDIYVTGHSMGSNLSCLFGYLLSKEVQQKVSVVSFAGARLGNQGFKDDFNQQSNLEHYRITNNRDIVTATPMYNYKHVGRNITLYDDKYVLYKNYNYNKWFKFSFFNCFSIREHDMELYYNRICKHVW